MKFFKFLIKSKPKRDTLQKKSLFGILKICRPNLSTTQTVSTPKTVEKLLKIIIKFVMIYVKVFESFDGTNYVAFLNNQH